MASLLTVPFTGASQENVNNSDSDASFLSDLEEVDHMKIGSGNRENEEQQLQFVDSYFRQDASLSDPSIDPYVLEESLNGSLPPWERLSDWIHCFCVVTFDLEIGQMIEVYFLFKLTLNFIT